jgi:curved DNA-binding protein
MARRDYYDVIGVSRSATEKEIRQAYRKLARKFHPDLNPNDKQAEARFKEISEAYDVLSEADKRKKYDRWGHDWEKIEQAQKAGATAGAGFGGAPGGFRWTTSSGSSRAGGIPIDDDLAGGLFEQLFGGIRGAGRRSTGPVAGEDYEHPTEVTLEEAFNGTVRLIQIQSADGGVQTIEVKIPAGVTNGSRVRVAGKGGPGRNGGPPGDLLLIVTVLPHPKFSRDGADLTVQVDVHLYTAVLGGEVHVPTPKGSRLALKLPPETQNGQRFRLAGQGMPRLGSGGSADGGRGDLYAEVRVVLPTGLSERERDLFRQLVDLRGS